MVSIIIPFFNRVEFIGETISSVKRQTYDNIECLVIDDGSTKESLGFVSKILGADDRFRVIKRDRVPKGSNTCRNIGIDEAKGDYIIFLDSDDILADWCCETRVSFAEASQETDFFVFPELIFHSVPGDSNVLINLPNNEDATLRFLRFNDDAPWMTSGPLWRSKSIKENSLRWDEIVLGYQDIEFHLSALFKGLTFSWVRVRPDRYWKINTPNSIGKSLETKPKIESLRYIIRKFEGEFREKHKLQGLTVVYRAYFRLIQTLINGCYFAEAMRVVEEDMMSCQIGYMNRKFLIYYVLISASDLPLVVRRLLRKAIEKAFLRRFSRLPGGFLRYCEADLGL